MGKLQEPQARRRGRRSSSRYSCSVCRYTSRRRYNIERHKIRIHSASTKPRKCCDMVFRTKGDYYLHCEENHPNSRPNHITSRNKYKIFPKGLKIPASPMNLVSSSPKISEEMPYMLRSRVRPKIELPELADPESSGSAEHSELDEKPATNTADSLRTSESAENSELDEKPTANTADSLRTSESADESELDVKPIRGSTANSLQSSGYGTKSINSTFDSSEESRKMKLSSSEERDVPGTPDHERFAVDDHKIENAITICDEPSPIKFSKSDETTAGHGGKSPQVPRKPLDELNVTSDQRSNEGIVKRDETSDFTVTSEKPESSDLNASNAVKSKGAKITNENKLKENCGKRTLFASTPHQLPPKKRILLTLGLSNRENIANGRNARSNRTPFGDRLCPSPPSKPQEATPRKMRRRSKTIEASRLRKTMNLSRYSSASSDPKNNSETACKPKAPGIDVDLRLSGRSSWEECTRLMREYLQLIDFDTLNKVLL